LTKTSEQTLGVFFKYLYGYAAECHTDAEYVFLNGKFEFSPADYYHRFVMTETSGKISLCL